ncbi:uncharacterized protein UDID_18400 [Ustilago sp. UG-2017a]|nr:uncharacterized protein UDID_18400 [Ustilago sp. UG-2017a]
MHPAPACPKFVIEGWRGGEEEVLMINKGKGLTNSGAALCGLAAGRFWDELKIALCNHNSFSRQQSKCVSDTASKRAHRQRSFVAIRSSSLPSPYVNTPYHLKVSIPRPDQRAQRQSTAEIHAARAYAFFPTKIIDK